MHVSPSEEGDWEVAYRLADDTALSSTTEQKYYKQGNFKARAELGSAKFTSSEPDVMTVLKSTADLCVNITAPKQCV